MLSKVRLPTTVSVSQTRDGAISWFSDTSDVVLMARQRHRQYLDHFEWV
jgi:hypothetical protein